MIFHESKVKSIHLKAYGDSVTLDDDFDNAMTSDICDKAQNDATCRKIDLQ
ncbi:hypothetical protein VHA01S_040_00040 [Vibrio halioticoli NBRC 102217]|uniref:Uncharacterized protein n=1 Tax=Vibrio halioticoli NBRC 102217 TaxID=1219072 RepID=V5F4Q7_9VIBR|nr:hypothetical protein VHA01S_040_00040 [Vibrio halioticoli NBRC 102217]